MFAYVSHKSWLLLKRCTFRLVNYFRPRNVLLLKLNIKTVLDFCIQRAITVEGQPNPVGSRGRYTHNKVYDLKGAASGFPNLREDENNFGLPRNSPANAGDAGDPGDPSSIPGSGRSSSERNGNPLQYSFLENSMDRGAWWATLVHGVGKSRIRLSDWMLII